MSKQNDDEQARDWQQQFKQSVEALDAETISRITQARYRALDRQRKGFWSGLPLLPLSAVATACVFMLVLTLSSPPDNPSTEPFTDLELISSSEELEFYDDLEFYEWLEQNEAV